MNKVLLLNGPNLDMLGIREPGIYGTDTLETLEKEVRANAKTRGIALDTFQSNSEGELIDKLHAANGKYDGIIYNPGAHTHYSYALRDAVASIEPPVVEVHISDISTREEFRRISVIEPECVAQVKGKGKAGYTEALDILCALNPKNTLPEHRGMAQMFAPDEFPETCGYVKRLRSVKAPIEVEALRSAQNITDAAFAETLQYVKPGVTELEVCKHLESALYKLGAQDLAFSTIVAAGAGAVDWHHEPTDTVLEVGQCVVIDFGAKFDGYCSDMTRTVFLGQPDSKMQDAWDAIVEANETVEDMLRPGITGKAAHEKAEEILASHGFAGKMGHGLGHGVGLDIHEEPVLALRNDKPLQAGNVVTVEPGIYIPGEFGMRLEDFGLITDNGFDRFTETQHKMIVL